MELRIIEEEKKIKEDLTEIFQKIQQHTETIPTTTKEQVEKLSLLRSDIYEDLNQLQHISLILEVAKLLQKEFPEINNWRWHPKQTSKPDEADLTGFNDKKIIISSEVTTSQNPVGTIDSRMKKTLESLSTKRGKRFYFVLTKSMYDRAKTKIRNNNWDIIPRQI